jgi:hypothetical protein
MIALAVWMITDPALKHKGNIMEKVFLSLVNIKHNFLILGPLILMTIILWGTFAYNSLFYYSLYYKEINPDYPALIIGFAGILTWILIGFNDLNRSRIMGVTYNSPTSGKVGVPISYGCIAGFPILISSIAGDKLTLFAAVEMDRYYLALSVLIPILIDVYLSIKTEPKEKGN